MMICPNCNQPVFKDLDEHALIHTCERCGFQAIFQIIKAFNDGIKYERDRANKEKYRLPDPPQTAAYGVELTIEGQKVKDQIAALKAVVQDIIRIMPSDFRSNEAMLNRLDSFLFKE